MSQTQRSQKKLPPSPPEDDDTGVMKVVAMYDFTASESSDPDAFCHGETLHHPPQTTPAVVGEPKTRMGVCVLCVCGVCVCV